jgi:Zn-dependent protease
MTYHPLKLGRVATSKTEVVDILKAWLALSLAFAFIYSEANFLSGSLGKILSLPFLNLFIISLFTAGLGFLLHELAHKFVAQRYGCVAEFRAWDQMILLALGLAIFVGFIFAAPGAVMISGMVTKKENGIISVAGAMTNYVLGLLFLGLGFLYPFLRPITSIGFGINMWLGLFNMIPFGPLDGLKVFHWNKAVWLGMVAVGVLFVFVV